MDKSIVQAFHAEEIIQKEGETYEEMYKILLPFIIDMAKKTNF